MSLQLLVYWAIHPSYTAYPGQEDISVYYSNLTFEESTDDEGKYITTYMIYENYGYYTPSLGPICFIYPKAGTLLGPSSLGYWKRQSEPLLIL